MTAISSRLLSLPALPSRTMPQHFMSLCGGIPCLVSLAALVVMFSGCRGSYPMARAVQVTHDPSLELPEYHAPPQRLATAKPRVGSERSQPGEFGPNSDISQASRDAESEGRVSAVSHIDDSSAAIRSVSTATTKTMQYAADANVSTGKRSNPEGRAIVREGNTQVESVQRTISSNPSQDSAQVDLGQLPLDDSEMFEALKNSPPEAQQLAMRQWKAAMARNGSNANVPQDTHLKATNSQATNSQRVGDVLRASLNETVTDQSTVHVAHASHEDRNAPASASLSHYTEDSSATKTASHVSREDVHVESLSHKSEPKSQETVSAAITSTLSAIAAAVSPANTQSKDTQSKDTQSKDTQSKDTQSNDVVDVGSLSESQLYDELLGRLSKSIPDESDADRSRRLVMLRHLMVLSGDIDDAVSRIDGMAENEQEYLRHQLLGLWTIIDPDGHPVPGRRFSAALPQLREATTQLAAATDSLDVRSLAFCTEIESYGQIKKFPNTRFKPGQQVILYCEIENFVASKVANGFETNLQGSYDVFNEAGDKVASQLLPADRQVSNNYLRDYFIAYQMYLPKDLDGGKYRLQLTIEDLNGKKYGQSVIAFELAR